MSSRVAAIAVTAVLALSAFGADNDAKATITTTTPTPSATVAPRYGTWGVDLAGMDRTARPGDDFFKFVNGQWAATTQIPADETRWGAFNLLRDLSEARVRAIVDKWAADKNLKAGSDEAKVAAFYRAYLDDATAEKLDAKPIQPYLDAVKKAKTHEDVAKLMGRTPAGFGSALFGTGVSDDAKNPEQYALYLSQSGLGLPDREYYLRDNFKPQRERYQQYVADMLRLAGWEEPEKNAAEIVALETKIAEAHWTRAESRDRDKTYNPTTLAELEKNAPGFPWTAFFTEAGINKVERAVVRQNTALPKLAKIYGDTPVTTLQAWQAFHIADDAAPLLSKRFVDAEWEFRSKFLNGAQQQRPRWKRAIAASEGALGEAIGRTYVAEYFPPESKAKMEKLVSDLRVAMKGRIEKLEWMGPETKTKALEKLAKFNVKIGYPVKWRDYAKLTIKEGDLVGNAERASKFRWDFNVARIGKKTDDDEWGMTPQTVNAYYSSSKNEIVFPAAILQPPFFDPKADPAVNYGAIGGVIGHEITHGFDDQGRKSDGDGVLRDWWAADDATKFEAQAAKLGAQYEGFKLPQAPDVHIIGKQTMGENIGDLGGILMALDAYRVSLGGQPAPVIDGFTGDQRVFLGWGQVWRTMVRDEALKQLVMTDSHSPGMVRAFAPLRNVDAWYEAFDVKEGDANYVKPEDRVRIW
ncbi:MAG TPA: M13-type metalloendopeptidase [Thermoanaerobaculia bacterium]|nr:M13-type metalloendopeptidase [Thermoanaerobaculia bacterium]